MVEVACYSSMPTPKVFRRQYVMLRRTHYLTISYLDDACGVQAKAPRELHAPRTIPSLVSTFVCFSRRFSVKGAHPNRNLGAHATEKTALVTVTLIRRKQTETSLERRKTIGFFAAHRVLCLCRVALVGRDVSRSMSVDGVHRL